VQTVIPYFERFLQSWPTIADLAAAPEELVLKAWEGLGYYSRVRNLHAAARRICQEHGGRVPAEWQALRALPGIGDYTAGAILSIAFGQAVPAVDGNVVRVFARLASVPWEPAEPAHRREVGELDLALQPSDRPGDWNEALMDLGATICLPRRPDCPACPVRQFCQALTAGRVDQLPVRPVRKASPVQRLIVLVLYRQGRVHIRRRPQNGLLGGLWEFDWLDEPPDAELLPLGPHTHVFTHLKWQMDGYMLDLDNSRPGMAPDLAMICQFDAGSRDDDRWVDAAELLEKPFPVALAFYRDQVLARLQRQNP